MMLDATNANAAPMQRDGVAVGAIASEGSAPTPYLNKATRGIPGRRRRRQAEPLAAVSIYLGLVRVGDAVPVGEIWQALSVDGEVLGEFNSRKAAARAVARGGAA